MSFGTDLDTIQAYRAASEPYNAAEYTPLGNSINNLWQRRHFRSENKTSGARSLGTGFEDPQYALTDTIYARMKPALRLASLFHSLSIEFFIKIYLASVDNHVLDVNFDSNNKHRGAYETMLASLSGKLRIYMGESDDSRCRNAHGKCSPTASDERPLYIQLNSDYLYWYSRPDYDARDIQRQNIIACSLAVTLLHEHAHAVWQIRNYATFTENLWRNYALLKGNEAGLNNDALREAGVRALEEEPAHSPSDWEVELGMSWEQHWFGGLFPHFNETPGRLHMQARTGTCWTEWDKLDDKVNPNYWVVAVRTYNQFFNQNAWLAEQAWRDRLIQNKARYPVSGDEFEGGLAVYLTPVKVIKPWPTYSATYAEHFKKRLDAYAQGLDIDALL
jgi:hypothetical protein